MKKWVLIFLILLFLFGCNDEDRFEKIKQNDINIIKHVYTPWNCYYGYVFEFEYLGHKYLVYTKGGMVELKDEIF